MSVALEPQTASVKAKHWLSKMIPSIFVAVIVGFGGSYMAIRVHVAVLTEQYKSLSEEVHQLRSDMRAFIGNQVTKDEYKATERVIDLRFDDVHSNLDKMCARLRSLEAGRR